MLIEVFDILLCVLYWYFVYPLFQWPSLGESKNSTVNFASSVLLPEYFTKKEVIGNLLYTAEISFLFSYYSDISLSISSVNPRLTRFF